MKVTRKTTSATEIKKEMLNLNDLASFLGVAYGSAWKLSHEPGFPVCKVGRLRLVHRDALIEWIKGKQAR